MYLTNKLTLILKKSRKIILNYFQYLFNASEATYRVVKIIIRLWLDNTKHPIGDFIDKVENNIVNK